MKAILVALALIGGGALWASQQFMLFVIPPIGGIPDGMTVVMKRTGQMQFVESPDAMCRRTTGSVTILCRAAAFAALREENIIARLPYSRDLYLWSTGGEDYSTQGGQPGLLTPLP